MSECDPVCTEGLYRGDQVKTRPLGRVLTPHDWRPRKKRFGHRQAQRDDDGREAAEDGEARDGARPARGPRREPAP